MFYADVAGVKPAPSPSMRSVTRIGKADAVPQLRRTARIDSPPGYRLAQNMPRAGLRQRSQSVPWPTHSFSPASNARRKSRRSSAVSRHDTISSMTSRASVCTVIGNDVSCGLLVWNPGTARSMCAAAPATSQMPSPTRAPQSWAWISAMKCWPWPHRDPAGENRRRLERQPVP